MPCEEGTANCYSIEKTCIYERNYDNRGLNSCRNGQHLSNCSHIECPGYFKCVESYCIPLHYVCDGVVDCPGKYDELGCNVLECPGLLRCIGSYLCISPLNICDGVYQCPYIDDERFCTLVEHCPYGCYCQGGVVSCSHVHQTDIMSLLSTDTNILIINLCSLSPTLNLSIIHLFYLDLSNNDLQTDSDKFIMNLPNLLYLNLANNSIKYFSQNFFKSLSNLLELDIKHNSFTRLSGDIFYGLSSLQYLDLSGLYISEIEDDIFYGCSNLFYLDISNNSLNTLNPSALYSVSDKLHYLLLSHNEHIEVDVALFPYLNQLKFFESDRSFLCCFVNHNTKCEPPQNLLNSCHDLIYSVSLKVIVSAIAVCCVLSNLCAVLWHTYNQTKHNHMLIHLSLCDLFMGLYISIIMSADLFYYGQSVVIHDKWRYSFFCRLAAALNVTSTISSIINLMVSLYTTVFSVLFPFQNVYKNWKIQKIVLYSLIPVLAAASFMVHPFILQDGLPFGICLLFSMGETNNKISIIYTYIHGIITFLAVLAVIVVYSLILYKMKVSRQSVSRDMTPYEKQMTWRTTLIIIINVLSWIPQTVVVILFGMGKSVSSLVWIWLVVFVFPLNSCLNPIIYTFSSKRFIDQFKLTFNKT